MKKENLQKFFTVFFPIFIYIIFAYTDKNLPGVYMDSVSPDYQSTWMLRNGLHTPAWIYPDNWLAGSYNWPLLNSLYGGNFTAYVAAIFFKIAGFGLDQLRIYHITLGAVLTGCMSWALLQWRVSSAVVCAVAIALALDPGYIFAWRTQYYLQLTPLIFTFVALGLLGSSQDCLPEKTKKKIFIAGLLLGFASYNYFVFAFYAAAIATTFSISFSRTNSRLETFKYLAIGIAIGFMPYIYAHTSIIINLGFENYISSLQEMKKAYGLDAETTNSISHKVGLVFSRLSGMQSGNLIESTMLSNNGQKITVSPISSIILFGTMAVYGAIVAIGKWAPGTSKGALLNHILASSIAIHFIFGIAVGSPLSFQHFIMLQPLFYAFFASVTSYAIFRFSPASLQFLLKIIVFFIAASISIVHINQTRSLTARLSLSGGEGLYSDVINKTADKIRMAPTDAVILFPQWGYWAGVVTLNGPRHSVVEAANIDAMRAKFASEAWLGQKQHFFMILGQEIADDDDKLNQAQSFAQSVDLRLVTSELVRGTNQRDSVLIAIFQGTPRGDTKK